jgi:DNA-binding response OmpR family regulator
MTVLIVEDELLIGMALRLILRIEGYRVRGPFGLPEEALSAAAAEEPEVAFIDINLQGSGDGIEVARRLRERHGTTCIFVTARPDLARGASDAALGLMEKPYNPGSVVQAVAYAMAARAGEPPGSVPPGLELLH